MVSIEHRRICQLELLFTTIYCVATLIDVTRAPVTYSKLTHGMEIRRRQTLINKIEQISRPEAIDALLHLIFNEVLDARIDWYISNGK